MRRSWHRTTRNTSTPCERENTGKMPDPKSVGDLAEDCDFSSGRPCTMQHPTYGVVAKHIPSLATISEPSSRCASAEEIPRRMRERRTDQFARVQRQSQQNSVDAAGYKVAPTRRKVRHTSRESHVVSKVANSPVPLNPVGAHMCQLSCDIEKLHCRAAPGLIALLWLVLRATGLGGAPGAKGKALPHAGGH